MENDALLNMKDITKNFPGVKALNHVNFELKSGEVHALLGENGAGKSTLIKILAGIYPMDSGEIYIGGQKKEITSVLDSKKLGISVIHQEIFLVPKMTVRDNILLGTEDRFFIDFKKRREKAADAIKSLNFDINVDSRVGDLSIAQQQIVEIVQALAVNDAKIIVMDEPTASISEKDTEKLFQTIGKLKENGIGIIYISHRMEEVMQIADRVTVLRDGNYIDTKKVNETDRAGIINMMVGRRLEEIYNYHIENVGEKILELKGVCNEHLKHIDFDLRKGEVHGIYGLVGAGRTELARVIFGIDDYGGDIFLEGKKIKIKLPSDAIKNSIALVPEDRKADGLVIGNTVKFNLLITILNKVMKLFSINRKQTNQILDTYKSRLNIKYYSPSQRVVTLSGGNQQKIVLSKWLATRPKILILDEPTRGIDIGAKFEIYDLIYDLIRESVSIILISSELNEIINLCTRVSVMREGRIAGIVNRDEFDQQTIFDFAISSIV